MSREIIAVIPAAGVGSRMQANKPNEIISKSSYFLTALFHRISLYFTVNYP